MVTVYFIGDVSKELCGGPHVKNTKELDTLRLKKKKQVVLEFVELKLF